MRCGTPQDPLYLPADAELTVSLWRLTDTRKVWYEWFAEAFLPVPSSSVSSPIWKDTLSPMNMSPDSTFLSPAPTTPVQATSPFKLDIPQLTLQVAARPGSFGIMEDKEKESVSLVKISQTALHNAGGKSSWIGL